MKHFEARIRNVDDEPFATLPDMTRKIGFHAIVMQQVCELLLKKEISFLQKSKNMLAKNDIPRADEYNSNAQDLKVARHQALIIAQSDSVLYELMSRNQRQGLPNRHDRRRSEKSILNNTH